MTTTASAHALPTVEPAQDAGILPCPHFEGVEKRVEIDFHDGSCEQGASPGLSRCAFEATTRRSANRKIRRFDARRGIRLVEKP